MRGFVVVTLCLAFLSGGRTVPEEQLVLHAQPSTKVESAADTTVLFKLSTSESQRAQLVILKRDGRYIWASRDGRELIYSVNGVYHIFTDPRGAGYIKVEDQSILSEEYRDPGPPVRYFESISLGLATLTYWGTAEGFSL